MAWALMGIGGRTAGAGRAHRDGRRARDLARAPGTAGLPPSHSSPWRSGCSSSTCSEQSAPAGSATREPTARWSSSARSSPRRRPFLLAASERLAVPQVALPLGVVTALCGVGMHTTHDVLLAAVAVVVLGATVWVGRLVSAPVLVWVAGTGAGLWWLWLVVLGLVRAIEEPTVHALWVERKRTRPAGRDGAGPHARSPSCPGHATSGSRAPASRPRCSPSRSPSPCVDGTTTELGVVALVALLAWTAVAAVLPTPDGRWWPRSPLAVTALPAVGIVAGLAAGRPGQDRRRSVHPSPRLRTCCWRPGDPIGRPAARAAARRRAGAGGVGARRPSARPARGPTSPAPRS